MPIDFHTIKQEGEEMLRQLNQRFHVDLGYNRQSVEWLDWYISQNRDFFPTGEVQNMALSIGYILGEAIIREYGGEWEYDEDFHQWAVNMKKGKANPIGKTRKYLEDYLDSIESFFEIIGTYK
jgi:hypothetical protein